MIRTVPHSYEAEVAVLGNLLNADTDPAERARNCERVAARVPVEALHLDAHRRIYARMLALREAGHGVDLVTLMDALREAGELADVGGSAKLADLAEQGIITSYLDEYVRILLRDYARRLAIQECTAAITTAYDDGADPAALIASLTEHLAQVAEAIDPAPARQPMGPRALADVLDEYVGSLDTPETDFVTFGIAAINERLGGGALRGEVVLCGGPHSAGKTAYVLQIVTRNARQYGHRVLVISREMTSVALVRRVIAQEARIDAKVLRRRDLDPFDRGRLHRTLPRLSGLPIWFDDQTSTLSGIRRLVRAGDYRLVVVDYLQLLDPPASARGNRRLEVTEISRALKKLARRAHCTVIAISSLSRLPVERGKRQAPTTSSLKESGDLEYDADVVMLVHWPDTTQSEREIHLGKVRDGETGGAPITIDYEPTWVRFVMPEVDELAGAQRALREPGEDAPC